MSEFNEHGWPPCDDCGGLTDYWHWAQWRYCPPCNKVICQPCAENHNQDTLR